MRNIRENLFWAFAYNTILIPVAMGVLYPAFGILLDPITAGRRDGAQLGDGRVERIAAAARPPQRRSAGLVGSRLRSTPGQPDRPASSAVLPPRRPARG